MAARALAVTAADVQTEFEDLCALRNAVLNAAINGASQQSALLLQLTSAGLLDSHGAASRESVDEARLRDDVVPKERYAAVRRELDLALKDLESSEDGLASALGELKTARDDAAVMRGRLDSAQDDLEAAHLEIASLRKLLAEAEGRARALEDAAAEYVSPGVSRRLQLRCDTAECARAALEGERASLAADAHSARMRFENAQAEMGSLLAERAALVADIRALERRLADVCAERDARIVDADTFRREADAARAAYANARADVEALRLRLDEPLALREREASAWYAEKHALLGELRALQEERDVALSELRAARTDRDILDAECTRLSRLLRDAEVDADQRPSRADMRRLAELCDEQRETIRVLQTAGSDAEGAKVLARQRDALNAQWEARLEARDAAHDAQVAQLRRRLNEALEDRDTRAFTTQQSPSRLSTDSGEERDDAVLRRPKRAVADSFGGESPHATEHLMPLKRRRPSPQPSASPSRRESDGSVESWLMEAFVPNVCATSTPTKEEICAAPPPPPPPPPPALVQTAAPAKPQANGAIDEKRAMEKKQPTDTPKVAEAGVVIAVAEEDDDDIVRAREMVRSALNAKLREKIAPESAAKAVAPVAAAAAVDPPAVHVPAVVDERRNPAAKPNPSREADRAAVPMLTLTDDSGATMRPHIEGWSSLESAASAVAAAPPPAPTALPSAPPADDAPAPVDPILERLRKANIVGAQRGVPQLKDIAKARNTLSMHSDRSGGLAQRNASVASFASSATHANKSAAGGPEGAPSKATEPVRRRVQPVRKARSRTSTGSIAPSDRSTELTAESYDIHIAAIVESAAEQVAPSFALERAMPVPAAHVSAWPADEAVVVDVPPMPPVPVAGGAATVGAVPVRHALCEETFVKRPHCHVCKRAIAMMKKGLKCAGCDVIVHAHCADELFPSCPNTRASAPSSPFALSPARKRVREDAAGEGSKTKKADGRPKKRPKNVRLFGGSLAELAEHSGRNVPSLVEECIAAVEARGLDEKGIYRLSGAKSKVDRLRADFEAGRADVGTADVHVIAGVLKMFLRELSARAIPGDAGRRAMAAAAAAIGSAAATEVAAREVVSIARSLPPPHVETIAALVAHWRKIVSRVSSNAMGPANLGTVFGPNLLESTAPLTDVAAVAAESAQQAKVVELLLAGWH